MSDEDTPKRDADVVNQHLQLIFETAQNIKSSRVDTDLKQTWVYPPRPEPTDSDIAEMPVDDLFPPDDADVVVNLQKEAIDAQRRVTDEFVYQHSWGGERYYRAAAEPVVKESEGSTTEALFVGVDITDTRHLQNREAALIRQNDRLEDFAGVLTHDLRNPLSIALGNLSMLESEKNDRIKTIEKALTRMDAIITDALTLAREGKHVVDPEPVSLAAMCRRAWDMVDTEEATLTSGEDTMVLADPARLATLLENLFRNAVEHGGATVQVRTGGLDNGFYIEDNGSGIPPEQREAIFEKGFSGSGGTGFGLAIVETIADAHGWKILATEGSDGGARFELINVNTRK